MKNHPRATQDDVDNMKKTEEVLAGSSNLAGVEKIPQVRTLLLKNISVTIL